MMPESNDVTAIDQLAQAYNMIKSEISKVIVGQNEIIVGFSYHG